MKTLGQTWLERNLAALRTTSPRSAEAIQAASPRPDLLWLDTPDGVPSATITDLDPLGIAPVSRSLASQRRPLEEAKRLTGPVKVSEAAVLVVLGLGLGYHVAELARRLKKTGILIVFEPDLSLARSVFERLDMSAWIGGTNLVVLSDPDDGAAMAEALHGNEHAVALGLQIVEHPASRPRLGEAARRFVSHFTDVVRAARTTVVTTMVQTHATLRNLTQNIDHYALGPGIGDLEGVYAGKPAVVVSAGPSLERNVDLLARPGVRERVVIIAVQTVLKPLLARGIRPHFVTALDYHEVSRRFYEGLSRQAVEGVTLVVEPKVNPAVTGAFPGVVRCAGDSFLDQLLGEGLSRPMGQIAPGATVAHLAYYLARFLGCDPVALIGQDLGFTDGQYYAAGAAIHEVWAPELNAFNTLEMLEWQRIARHRHLLRRATDTLGRPIYTDEQMATYLVQFQRDFMSDAGMGLTTIDATEGGVAKLHTTPMTLGAFLERHGGGAPLPSIPSPAGAPDGQRQRRRDVGERLRAVRRDVFTVGKFAREARTVLAEMLEHHADQERVNGLIGRVERLRDRVTALQPAFALVQRINQTGAFNRTRADRAINVEADDDPMGRQRKQIQRDLTNVSWLADAADALGTMLEESLGALGGTPKRTRDPARPEDNAAPGEAATHRTRVVHALIPVAGRSGLGGPEAWSLAWSGQRAAVACTVERLLRSKALAGVTLVCESCDRVRDALGTLAAHPKVRLESAGVAISPPRGVATGRLWAADCWRGGLGNLTCYDEVLDPGAMAPVMERLGMDAAVVVGADWCLVDPALCDAVIERYHEDPRGHRLTFTMAAPGLAPALVDRAVVLDLARNRPTAGAFASIGGMLGYVPIAPMADLIARSVCVSVAPAVRDALVRCIPDTPERATLLRRALRAAGLDPLSAAAAEIAGSISALAAEDQRAFAGPSPQHTTHTIGRGEPSALPGPQRSDALITIRGGLSDRLAAAVVEARSAGYAGVHVFTDMVGTAADAGALLASGPDIISIDWIADDPAVYARLRPDLGATGCEQARANTQRLMAGRAEASGVPIPWIVPTLVRRDEVYEQVETFFDHWLMRAGWAVLAPMDEPIAGQRIRPLPLPSLALWRRQTQIGGGPQ